MNPYFKVIVKAITTTERRVMIDIRAMRESYKHQEIDNVGWLRSSANLADGLTKFGPYEALNRHLDRGSFLPVFEQWVIRTYYGSRSAYGED